MEPPSSEPNTDALQVATSTDALQVAWAFPPLLMRLLCINDGGEPSPTIQQQPQRRSSRPETPRVKGHRFSRERFEEEDGHRSPQSPRSKPRLVQPTPNSLRLCRPKARHRMSF